MLDDTSVGDNNGRADVDELASEASSASRCNALHGFAMLGGGVTERVGVDGAPIVSYKLESTERAVDVRLVALSRGNLSAASNMLRERPGLVSRTAHWTLRLIVRSRLVAPVSSILQLCMGVAGSDDPASATPAGFAASCGFVNNAAGGEELLRSCADGGATEGVVSTEAQSASASPPEHDHVAVVATETPSCGGTADNSSQTSEEVDADDDPKGGNRAMGSTISGAGPAAARSASRNFCEMSARVRAKSSRSSRSCALSSAAATPRR